MAKRALRARQAPVDAVLRMYNVGFGDCFLLSLRYPRGGERHVLIDFGSARTAGGKSRTLGAIAADIEQRTGGKLHAIVATHRHRDHISGFATTTKGNGPGDVIRRLAPDVVVQPWTERLDAPPDAMSPPLRGRQVGVAKGLGSMHLAARALGDEATRNTRRYPSAVKKQIAFLAEDNLKNLSAVKNLATMAPNEYVHAGHPAVRLRRAIPGVRVAVLGPATPEQHPSIARQRARDAAEYWHLQARMSAGSRSRGGARPLFRRVERDVPPRLRWITRQMDLARGQQVLGIARALDSAMNNTSVILLLTIGDTRILLPGDAQGESWDYVLRDAKGAASAREELARVDAYKVGHHGSLNATPRSLWQGFTKRGKKRDPLVTALSTRAGVHGTVGSKTEVPRRTLVHALRKESELHATINAANRGVGRLYEDIRIPLRKRLR